MSNISFYVFLIKSMSPGWNLKRKINKLMKSFCRGTNYGSPTHCKSEYSSLLIKATWVIQCILLCFSLVHILPMCTCNSTKCINISPTEGTFSKVPTSWEISMKFHIVSAHLLVFQNSQPPLKISIPSVQRVWIFSGSAQWHSPMAFC